MSGGGLGGCVIALVGERSQAEALAALLREKGPLTHGSKACGVSNPYANIAIVKYWGKKDAEKMIPSTSSISLTLENMYTETQLRPLPATATGDEFYIDGQLQSLAEHAKISKIIDRFRSPEDGFVRVDTSNNMPTAAGLSSSSSGLSALVKACNAYFQTGYQTQELAQLG